jgi:hypothetical protein
MVFTPMVEGELISEVKGMMVNDYMGLDTIRVRMDISSQDYENYHKYGDCETGYAITDQATGIQVMVRRADCGAGCRCAAEIVEVVSNPLKEKWDAEMAEMLANR